MPGGRPTKLTDEFQDRFLALIAQGNYMSVAAEALGVSPETVREWVARGEGRHERPPAPRYVQFAKEYRRASAVTEIRVLRDWRRHFAANPREARQFLTRRFPDRWSMREGRKVEVSGGLDLNLERQQVRDEVLRELYEEAQGTDAAADDAGP